MARKRAAPQSAQQLPLKHSNMGFGQGIGRSLRHKGSRNPRRLRSFGTVLGNL